MTRDELQDLIIDICEKNGIRMNYVVSGKIADAIEMEAVKTIAKMESLGQMSTAPKIARALLARIEGGK